MEESDEPTSAFKILRKGENIVTNTKIDEVAYISLRGLNLPDSSIAKLESQIRQMVREEAMKGEQFERKIFESKKGSQGGLEIPINVSLRLNLPDSSIAKLESQIRDVVRTYILKDGNVSKSPGEQDVVCVCALTSVPGYTLYPPASFPSAPFPQHWAVCTPQDVLRVDVEDGREYRLTPDEMIISLESAPEVTWEKQIKAFICQLHSERVLLTTKNQNHGGRFNGVKIHRSCFDPDTLIFAKAAFLGVMTDMFNFDIRRF